MSAVVYETRLDTPNQNMIIHYDPLQLTYLVCKIEYRGLAKFSTVEQPRRSKNYGGYLSFKLSPKESLKMPIMVDVQTSSGISFHIVGTSKAKLEMNSFADL